MGDVAGTGDRIEPGAQARHAAGPPPLPPDEHERMRYALADSLDDLVGGPRPEELPFIVATVTSDLCEVAMENRRAFRGTGKWMYRMAEDRKSTRLNSSHANISYAVFCLKKKKNTTKT